MEQLNFTVKGKTYHTEDIRVGRFVDFWKMRAAISMGTYGQLYRFSMVGADEALLMMDAEAFFTSFCPEFLRDLKPGSIKEMGLEDWIELRDVYLNTILPWLNKVEELLKQKKDDE